MTGASWCITLSDLVLASRSQLSLLVLELVWWRLRHRGLAALQRCGCGGLLGTSVMTVRVVLLGCMKPLLEPHLKLSSFWSCAGIGALRIEAAPSRRSQ